jgi:hypothetical protein
MADVRKLLGPIRYLHERIRASVVAACERETSEELAKVVKEEEGDTHSGPGSPAQRRTI